MDQKFIDRLRELERDRARFLNEAQKRYNEAEKLLFKKLKENRDIVEADYGPKISALKATCDHLEPDGESAFDWFDDLSYDKRCSICGVIDYHDDPRDEVDW